VIFNGRNGIMLDEFARLANAYDPAQRLAECPDPDATTLLRIEVDFAIPVEMTQEQQRRLLEVIDDITDSPWNAPREGVHWMAEVGSKPHWSRADAAMLGVEAGPDAPASGGPTFDDSILHVGTCARAFVSDFERERKHRHRARPRRPRPERDAAIETLETVADRCRKTLAILKEARAKEEHGRDAD
jgi:hypothetical protein